MRLVYINQHEPVKKVSKKEEIMQAAHLLAGQSRNSQASQRRSIRLLDMVLNNK